MKKTKPVQKPAPLPSVEECFNRKLGSSLSRALQNDIKPIAKGIHVSTVGNETQPCEILTLNWEVKNQKVTNFWGRYTTHAKVVKKVNCSVVKIIKTSKQDTLKPEDCIEEVNEPEVRGNNR